MDIQNNNSIGKRNANFVPQKSDNNCVLQQRKPSKIQIQIDGVPESEEQKKVNLVFYQQLSVNSPRGPSPNTPAFSASDAVPNSSSSNNSNSDSDEKAHPQNDQTERKSTKPTSSFLEPNNSAIFGKKIESFMIPSSAMFEESMNEQTIKKARKENNINSPSDDGSSNSSNNSKGDQNLEGNTEVIDLKHGKKHQKNSDVYYSDPDVINNNKDNSVRSRKISSALADNGAASSSTIKRPAHHASQNPHSKLSMNRKKLEEAYGGGESSLDDEDDDSDNDDKQPTPQRTRTDYLDSGMSLYNMSFDGMPPSGRKTVESRALSVPYSNSNNNLHKKACEQTYYNKSRKSESSASFNKKGLKKGEDLKKEQTVGEPETQTNSLDPSFKTLVPPNESATTVTADIHPDASEKQNAPAMQQPVTATVTVTTKKTENDKKQEKTGQPELTQDEIDQKKVQEAKIELNSEAEKEQKRATSRIKTAFILSNIVMFYVLYFMNHYFKPLMIFLLIVTTLFSNFIWLGMSIFSVKIVRRSTFIGKIFVSLYWMGVGIREIISAVFLWFSPAVFFSVCEGGLQNATSLVGLNNKIIAGDLMTAFEISVYSIIFFLLFLLILTETPNSASKLYTIFTFILVCLMLAILPFWLNELMNLFKTRGFDVYTMLFSYFYSNSASSPSSRENLIYFNTKSQTGNVLREGEVTFIFSFITPDLIHSLFTVLNFICLFLLISFNVVIGLNVCLKVSAIWGIIYMFLHPIYISFFVVFQTILSAMVFFNFGSKVWTDGRSAEGAKKEEYGEELSKEIDSLVDDLKRDEKKKKNGLFRDGEQRKPALFVLVCCYQEDMKTIRVTFDALKNYPRDLFVIFVHDGQDNDRRKNTFQYLKQTIFTSWTMILKQMGRHYHVCPVRDTQKFSYGFVETGENEKYTKKFILISKKTNAGKRDSQILFFNLLNPGATEGFTDEEGTDNFLDYQNQLSLIRRTVGIEKSLEIINECQDNHITPPVTNAYYLWLDMDTRIEPFLIEKLEFAMTTTVNLAVCCPHLLIRRQNVLSLNWLINLQTIEMFISHVFYKSAESNFGGCLCAPGACSLYSNSAFRSVITDYKGEPKDVNSIARKSLGEDRYLCTLFLIAGYEIRFIPTDQSSTELYSDLKDYLNQRRRWVMSTFANNTLLIRKILRIMQKVWEFKSKDYNV